MKALEMMRKQFFVVINFLWLGFASFFLYYFLIQENILHSSISEILQWANHCTKHGHLFVIGLLPIYVGLIIFGAALLTLYLRAALWPIFSHYFSRWF